MIGGEAKLMCFFFNVFYKPYRGISIPVLYRPTAHRTAIINPPLQRYKATPI